MKPLIISCCVMDNLSYTSEFLAGITREKAELNLISNVLLKKYSKQVIPIVDHNVPVKVTIQLILRRLVEVVCSNK